MKITNFKNYKKISKIKSSKIKRTEKISDRKKYIRKRINKDSLKRKKKLENKLDKKHIDYQIKILNHKQKKNILEKKYKNKLLKRQTIATTSNIISDISRQINNNNEDDNIAVSGVGKVTNISSKILTRRVNKRGRKLVKNINKKSKKIEKLANKSNTNRFLKDNITFDKKLYQKNFIKRNLYKQKLIAKRKLQNIGKNIRKKTKEIMKNTLFLAMRLVGAILGFFGLTTFCIFFVFMFFFLIINSIFNFGDNGKTEFLENQIVYNTEIGKLIKPTTGFITDTFGLRIHPITGEVGNFHRGIDIANELGTKIYATKEGTVTISQADDSGYGLWVEIDHGNNVKTRYAHLSQTKVMVNQKVLQGQLIGLMGSTGMSTGSHLHFEIRINNEAVNPEKYIKFR